jgi:hypothetical protein
MQSVGFGYAQVGLKLEPFFDTAPAAASKIMLASKVIKSDSKMIISFHQSKYVAYFVGVTPEEK